MCYVARVEANQNKGLREREATDQSLDDERAKTDEELAARRSDDDNDADLVIADARDRADDILESARTKADEQLPTELASPDDQVALQKERSLEDEVLRKQRSTADDSLFNEREARRRALAALLALERKQTDDSLLLERHRADAALGSRDDFLAMVSHDLRNMLGGMALTAASLTNISGEKEVVRAIAHHAQRIQQYTARMDRLVGDLLDVVSIEAGCLALCPRSYDATELLRDTSDVFLAMAEAKSISLETRQGAGSAIACYDRERLLQVLANLVGNAIKFTKQGGRIELRLEPVEQALRFTIADTGIGIAPEKLERIFERFWQGSKQQQSGVGLGLYISKWVVDAHAGKIWVDSRLDEGSTFYFTIPTGQQAGAG